MLRAYGSTDATVGGGKVRKPGGGRGNGNGKGPNGGGGSASLGQWSSVNKYSAISVSGGVLTFPSNPAVQQAGRGETGYSSGDRYFEVVPAGVANGSRSVGFVIDSQDLTVAYLLGSSPVAASFCYRSNGAIVSNGTNFTTVASWVNGDVIGCRYYDNGVQGVITFYKNGTQVYTISNAAFRPKNYYPATGTWETGAGMGANSTMTLNTSGPFSSLPSGASAWT